MSKFYNYCKNRQNQQEEMPQRKIWTEEEDRVLKFLIQVRGITKWCVISETMEKQFNIIGRNGKQCRERYHNRLDKNISNQQWKIQEENKLFQIQDQVGNKWALISSKLPGRTDNCVKNHFYSKLRKSLRKLNKKTQKYLKKEYKDIKTATLYKIIQSVENKNKITLNTQHDTQQLCRKIKRSLKQFQDEIQKINSQNQQIDYIRSIVEDIAIFDPQIKKNPKKGGPKSNKKNQDEDVSPSKAYSNRVASTKSVYDQQQSQYSNSDIYSSSSFDHRSFCSNRSQGLIKKKKITCKSQNIQSESEQQESDTEKNQILYKSASSLMSLKKNIAQQKNLFVSLKLPQLPPKSPLNLPQLNKNQSFQKSSLSQSSQSQKILLCPTQRVDMMGAQQQFPPYMTMRLFSPKKPSHDDLMQMNHEQDAIFYGQKMQIENQELINNFSGLGIGNMPKLGFQFDL